MPDDAFGRLIEGCKRGKIDLDTARAEAAALAKTNDLRQSIHDVLAEVDRARSLDFEGDLATAELCRSAATSLDDPEIEILLAHVLGRVLVQLGRPEEAAEHVARAEQLCRDRA